jgi:hypothetical protein
MQTNSLRAKFREVAEARMPKKVCDFAADHNFDYFRDKSLVDDLTGTGYCTCWSRLVLRLTEV